jgi:hypothetical protein
MVEFEARADDAEAVAASRRSRYRPTRGSEADDAEAAMFVDIRIPQRFFRYFPAETLQITLFSVNVTRHVAAP